MIKKLISATLVLTTLSLVVGNIIVSGSYTTSGLELSRLEQQKQTLLQENQQLEEYILRFSSLQYLEQVSQAHDYQPASDIVSIHPSAPVAINR